jgi:hypothetical protein
MQPPIETAVDSATGSNPATPSTHRRTLVELSPTATSGALAYPVAGVGWQPSRFLVDRAEAERAFALAERLGSINAAAAQLGTTWPSLRKPSPATGVACRLASPAPSGSGPSTPPQAPPATSVVAIDPVFVALDGQRARRANRHRMSVSTVGTAPGEPVSLRSREWLLMPR